MSLTKPPFCSDFFAKRTYLRLLSVVFLAICMATLVGLTVFTIQRLHHNELPPAVDGMMDLSAEDMEYAPIYLHGMWEQLMPDESTRPVSFPIASITQATQNASYRLRFALPAGNTKPLYLCIPTYQGSLTVSLNGATLPIVTSPERWVVYQAMHTLMLLPPAEVAGQWQELILSGEFSNDSLTLYKRPVVLGTMENISTLVFFNGTNEIFLVGILMLALINCFVFMLFRPSHNIISLMTLFDTTLILRVIFSMDYMHSFARSLMPSLVISDTTSYSVKLFVLMLGGILGCLLSGILYDPKKKAPRWLIVPPVFLYLIFAFLFPLNSGLFEQYGRFFLYLTYAYTFAGIGYQFLLCTLSSRDQFTDNTKTYYWLQFSKTLYVGALIFVDIFLWTNYWDFMLLFYLYGIFFIIHVLVRLYDNNQSYRSVEILNQGLEQIVAKRTMELSQANKILSELSIRDPLTNVFNRLYFEARAEAACALHISDGTAVHLCMLDLDLFKSINDTYGHDAGDEQLRHLALLVKQHVGEHAIFARIGGEEFILLFVDKTNAQVHEYITLVLTALQEEARDNRRYTTASFGIASLISNQSLKILLKSADLALYQAKKTGRNRIVWFSDLTITTPS